MSALLGLLCEPTLVGHHIHPVEVTSYTTTVTGTALSLCTEQPDVHTNVEPSAGALSFVSLGPWCPHVKMGTRVVPATEHCGIR